jgi:hypothetical protein
VTPDRVQGGCLCGAVRYGIGLPPLWVAHCHCSMCRRAQGAGFVTWVGAAEDRFVLLSGAGTLARFQSSAAATRSFCSRCGSPLFFQSGHWPGQVHVTLASLDSAEGMQPAAHAYWGSRAGWIGWAGGELAKLDPEDHGESG